MPATVRERRRLLEFARNQRAGGNRGVGGGRSPVDLLVRGAGHILPWGKRMKIGGRHGELVPEHEGSG
jgi:hypothetical protein